MVDHLSRKHLEDNKVGWISGDDPGAADAGRVGDRQEKQIPQTFLFLRSSLTRFVMSWNTHLDVVNFFLKQIFFIQ